MSDIDLGRGWEMTGTCHLGRAAGEPETAGVGGDLKEECILFNFKGNWQLLVEWDWICSNCQLWNTVYIHCYLMKLSNASLALKITFVPQTHWLVSSLSGSKVTSVAPECSVHSEGSAKICWLIDWLKEKKKHHLDMPVIFKSRHLRLTFTVSVCVSLLILSVEAFTSHF